MRRKFFKSEKLRDIRELVRRSARLYSGKTAFKEIGPNREILEYSFRRLEKDINALGTKLLGMGMKGCHIAIIGENSCAWVISYLAVVNGVGVAIPIDKELTDDDIAKLLNKGDADTVICSNTFAPAMKNILQKCPGVRVCIIMNSAKEYPGFLELDKLIVEGQRLIESGNHEYLDAAIDRDDLCQIVFTSGTTGANKGVMLSHKNIMAVVYGALSLIDPRGVSFSVLPISHTYECSCHILGGIYSGIAICFNDSLKKVMENMKLFKPNSSLMVPLFLEAMHKKIWKETERNNLSGYLRYGIRVSNLFRKFGIDMRRIYFKPILESFGGNLSRIICGGAPLRQEIIKGLGDIGIDILNGYGITECAPLVSTNSTLWAKKGSVGRVIPGIQVRIGNANREGTGEIQVKGDNVMLGYYKDSDNTKLSFTEDGWFRTGDLGYLDKDNFLYINGREKNLIILSNGKNVHPEEIEDIIIERMPYVKEVVVFSPAPEGGNEGCITAYVYIDEELMSTNADMDMRKKLDQDIKLLNRSLPSYKRVTNVLIRNSEFEKTTTKKIKRSLMVERGV